MAPESKGSELVDVTLCWPPCHCHVTVSPCATVTAAGPNTGPPEPTPTVAGAAWLSGHGAGAPSAMIAAVRAIAPPRTWVGRTRRPRRPVGASVAGIAALVAAGDSMVGRGVIVCLAGAVGTLRGNPRTGADKEPVR